MKSPRVLIVRLSAIGDVIHTMPLACAIRDAWPNAMLAWAVEERGAELLRGHAALDELLVLRKRWLASPAAVWRLAQQLKALRFDVAIDAQGLGRSAIVARLSCARRRIGFGGRWGREMSTWLNTELVNGDGLHAVDRHLRILDPLGIPSVPPGPARARARVRFDVPEDAADADAAQRMLREAGITGEFAVIGPGAGWPSKRWPLDRFAAVATHLGTRWRLPTLVIWGSAQERDGAMRIIAGSHGHSRAAPGMSLRQLAALSRRAVLFVGCDTGPLHLAAAVGTPCVGLYGPWPAHLHGPYGPQHICVQKRCLEGSTRQRRKASPQYMEAIDIGSVCDACDQIMARGRESVVRSP